MTTTAEAPRIAPIETAMTPQAPPTASPAAPASVALLLDRDALKTLIKEAVVEVLHEQRALIGSIFIEAWEDASLAAAMDEGMESEEVPVEEILKTLEEMRCAS